MSERYVLLWRGINVNPSTRVAMSELRELVSELGYTGVRTLLQSGNVILDASSRPDAAALDAAILARTGVRSRAIVLRLDEFRRIAEANPLRDRFDDLSKLVVTFLDAELLDSGFDPKDVERPSDAELAPELLVIAPRAIYQWCPDGILKSRLRPKWWRQFGTAVTSRNARTVDRILQAALAD